MPWYDPDDNDLTAPADDPYEDRAVEDDWRSFLGPIYPSDDRLDLDPTLTPEEREAARLLAADLEQVEPPPGLLSRILATLRNDDSR